MNTGAGCASNPQTLGTYPPRDVFGAAGAREDLIRDIPYLEHAMGDFNSVPWNLPPYRNVPSVLLFHLSNPNTSSPEPHWEALLGFFGPDDHQFGNLQDLYMFLTRIVIPNAIMDNRWFLFHLYSSNAQAPARIRLRYDAWTGDSYMSPAALPQTALKFNVRSILRTTPTPNGINFMVWLNTPLNAPSPVVQRMRHVQTELDYYLSDAEDAIRRIDYATLGLRTVWLLRIFWWLAGNNARLRQYKNQNWVGIGQEEY